MLETVHSSAATVSSVVCSTREGKSRSSLPVIRAPALTESRSDILQVISGKETKLKGTKKDPNCGFCQNHGVKILRKGRSPPAPPTPSLRASPADPPPCLAVFPTSRITAFRSRQELRLRPGAPLQARQLFRLRSPLYKKRSQPTSD